MGDGGEERGKVARSSQEEKMPKIQIVGRVDETNDTNQGYASTYFRSQSLAIVPVFYIRVSANKSRSCLKYNVWTRWSCDMLCPEA